MRKLVLIALLSSTPFVASAQGILTQAARIASSYGYNVDASSLSVSQAARIVQAQRQGRRDQGFDTETAIAVALGLE